MSSPGSIRAGRAYVELSLDDSPLKARLKQIPNIMKGMLSGAAGGAAAAALTGVTVATQGAAAALALAGVTAGATTAIIVNSAKHFADFGSELADMSARTGASVEALSALKYAA